MGFDKLPTELVCNIIYWAVQDPKISSFIRLREVNKLFEQETTKCFARWLLGDGKEMKTESCARKECVPHCKMQHEGLRMSNNMQIGDNRSNETACCKSYKSPSCASGDFKTRVLRQLIKAPNAQRFFFYRYIHAVADHLRACEQEERSATTEPPSLDRWIEDTCNVLAASGVESLEYFFSERYCNPSEYVTLTAAVVATYLRRGDIASRLILRGDSQSRILRNFVCPYTGQRVLNVACQVNQQDVIAHFFAAAYQGEDLKQTVREWRENFNSKSFELVFNPSISRSLLEPFLSWIAEHGDLHLSIDVVTHYFRGIPENRLHAENVNLIFAKALKCKRKELVETIIANAGEAYAVIKEREVGELLMGKMFGNILVSDDINACAKFLDLDVVKALISEKESDMISWAMSTCSYTLSAQTTRMLTERDIPLVGVRSFTPGVLRGSIDLVAYELSIHREEYTLGPRVYLAILGAVLKGHVDMVQYLLQIFDLSLEGFADIVVSLGCGTSLLTASIDSGSVGMVRLVKGSEVCAKTDVLRHENFARSLRNERAARFESRSSFREWHAVEYYPTFGGKYTVRKAVAPQWKVERALKVAQGT